MNGFSKIATSPTVLRDRWTDGEKLDGRFSTIPVAFASVLNHTFAECCCSLILTPAFLQDAERALNVRRGVLLARHAEQALSLLRSVGSVFSVALVNSELLTHDGLSLILQLRHEYPNLPVIAITGAMRDQVFEAAKALGDAGLVKKPITPELKAEIARLRETSGDRK